MDPQISFFINFFIKNGSHNTIYTFKNYFATVISAKSFQFQQNKSYPNRPLVSSVLRITIRDIRGYLLDTQPVNRTTGHTLLLLEWSGLQAILFVIHVAMY